MKLFVLIAAAVLSSSVAIAEQNPRPMPVKLYAAFEDLDTSTPEGEARLASRIRDRIEGICGTPHQALMRQVSTGAGVAGRRACIDAVRFAPSTPTIERAIARAKELAR